MDNQEKRPDQYLHSQMIPPAQKRSEEAGPQATKTKRGLFWPVFLAILVTASVTFVLTAAAGYFFYGQALRESSNNDQQKPPVQTSPREPEMKPDGQTLTFTDKEGVEEALEKFSTVYNLLQGNYYQEFSDAEMIEKMTVGLVGQMGSPYTFYLTPEYHESVEESMKGEYGGIGAIVMRDRDGSYVINDIIPDSPAESAGLYVGDIFVSVDGHDASEFEDIGQLAAYVRGEEGTRVRLVLYRPVEDREVSFTLTRRIITNVAVRTRMLDQGIGYIHLTEFSDHAAENFENAVLDLMRQGAAQLIIDLRNNGGGYAHECINMLDVLLPPATVATIKGRDDGQEYQDEWKTKTAALVSDDMRVVILLNKYSASASELFAGAMRDLGKAVIVGEQSFGKGVGTMMWQLEDKSAVQITGFEYFLPKGESVEGVGLVPDYRVELAPEVEVKAPNQRSLEEDTQLQKALELLKP
ncbi:MAG TPA: S41 family peptidase [Bacillota bacterium]|jgi:carboxyl-terminal processing protease|nr:S41 family peptidase [Fastidiosipila sp.]HPX93302.1 S41 family peptidase [Bacillota bacterium]HQB80961.1 S41 family peptidase [Bacillota bacterium]